MKKILTLILTVFMVITLFVGCNQNNVGDNQGDQADGFKTGLAVVASTSKSKDASDIEGLAQTDATVAAVIVDNEGKIINCMIDAVQAKINFSNDGKILTTKDTEFNSKIELGTDYGMKSVSKIGKEWSEQAADFAKYVKGKTLKEIKGITLNSEGIPTDSDLKSSVTVSVGDFIAAIEKAVDNAKQIGSSENDKIGIGTFTTIDKSKDAEEDDGLAQGYTHFAAITFNDSNVITGCILDALQSNINFNAQGKIISDTNMTHKTKNELAEGYGMKKVSGIGKEWFEQAEAFSKYVTGKTIDEVKGISINQEGKAEVDELKSSVTVTVGGFIEAIQKAKALAK